MSDNSQIAREGHDPQNLCRCIGPLRKDAFGLIKKLVRVRETKAAKLLRFSFQKQNKTPLSKKDAFTRSPKKHFLFENCIDLGKKNPTSPFICS